jgi:hypothetical protein
MARCSITILKRIMYLSPLAIVKNRAYSIRSFFPSTNRHSAIALLAGIFQCF